MDALNINTIQANLKRLTPMQLQMEAQSQVVPQWLVALEQQRRATMQDGLAAMQSPQQQTTVMEDLATKTATPIAQPAPEEGLAQFAEGGSVGKKDEWQLMLDDLAGKNDEMVVQLAPLIMEQGAGAGAPEDFLKKVQSKWTEAQQRLDKPRDFQAPAPVETSMETLGGTGKDTQPVGIEEASYAKPMDQNLADRFTRLDEMSKTSPQAAKNTAEAFLQAGRGRSDLPPEYTQTLEAFVNQPVPTPAPQPEQGIAQALPQPAPVPQAPAPQIQPLPMQEETLAIPQGLTELAPNGPADTSPVQQTKFLSPEEMDAVLSDPQVQAVAQPQGIEAVAPQPAPIAPVPQAIPAQQPTLETLQAPAVPKRPEPVVPDDVKSYWDIMKQGGEMPKPNLESFDKKSSRKEGQLKYAEDNNLSMALMSASAAILAGESPFTMINLGKGFTAGLQQYANGRKNINDLQDQIDDVVMARDKALNDQNMREFELQNNRLGTLAMIKQKVDMANAQNATELEKARMMAEAHRYGADRSASAHENTARRYQDMEAQKERKAALTYLAQAQAQLSMGQEHYRKSIEGISKNFSLTEEQKAEEAIRLEEELQRLRDNVNFAASLAQQSNIDTSKITAPSAPSGTTGHPKIKVVGDVPSGK